MPKPVQAPIPDELASARTDIDLFAGWLTALPNPDAILREQPGRAIRIYKDMQRDGHLRSVVGTRRLAVVGKDWEIVPASDEPSDVAVRDLVADALAGLTGFERARAALLDGVFTGFAVGEVLWGARAGRIVPTAILARGPHRFTFDVDGRLRLLTRAHLVDGEALPDRKFLVFQYEATPENPYGVGIGQSCYWPWWFKKHGIKFWTVFMERFGMPFPLGKFPPGTDAAVRDEFLDLLRTLQADTAAIVPNNLEIEFKEATRTSTVAVYDPFIALMNAEISKAVLGQTATTEGTPGALGSEQARADVREDLVAADADLLDEVLTTQLIRWIVDFNVGPDVPAPWFTTQTAPPADLTARATRDKTLVDMGARLPARYVYDTYGIPAPEGDEAVVERAAPGPIGPLGPMGPLGYGEAAGPAALDRLIADAERALGAVEAEAARSGARPALDPAALRQVVTEAATAAVAEQTGRLEAQFAELAAALRPAPGRRRQRVERDAEGRVTRVVDLVDGRVVRARSVVRDARGTIAALEEEA